jgi:hypothetical protein
MTIKSLQARAASSQGGARTRQALIEMTRKIKIFALIHSFGIICTFIRDKDSVQPDCRTPARAGGCATAQARTNAGQT